MIISNITPPQVWTASSRSLTNFGSGALAATPTTIASVAGAASVDLRVSAGTVASQTYAFNTGVGATAALNLQMSDGTNFIVIVSTAAAASSPASASTINTASVGPRFLNSDATHAGFYLCASYTLTI